MPEFGNQFRHAPVAQLDRALDYESRGREFESSRARHFSQAHRDSRVRFYPLAVDWQEDEVVGGGLFGVGCKVAEMAQGGGADVEAVVTVSLDCRDGFPEWPLVVLFLDIDQQRGPFAR